MEVERSWGRSKTFTYLHLQFIRQELIKMDSNAVVELKNKARQNDSGKHRYCFHENENAEMQEMLFVLPHEWYTRPHKHEHAAESQVVIEGEGYFILFDEWGNVSETFKISPQNNFIYRIQKGLWHMVLPISEQMVIYEIRENLIIRQLYLPNGLQKRMTRLGLNGIWKN